MKQQKIIQKTGGLAKKKQYAMLGFDHVRRTRKKQKTGKCCKFEVQDMVANRIQGTPGYI